MSAVHRLQKMLLVRALRPDRIIQSIQTFVTDELGSKFITPPLFDLQACFDDSGKQLSQRHPCIDYPCSSAQC